MVATEKPSAEGSMRPPALPIKKGSSLVNEKKPAAKAVKGDKEKTGRQSFSCAECRRLKLKCSREWPCTSCEKRGCAQICPNGEMRTGKGKRLILADTAELHQRISLLEVALAQSHAKTTSSPHPLLESPYLFSPRESKPTRNGKPFNAEEDDLLQGAFGTLTVGQEGQARFVGSFAGSEYLREGDNSEDDVPISNVGVSQTAERRSGFMTPPATAQGQWARPHEQLTLPGLGLHSSLFANGEVKYDLDRLRAELPDYDLEGRNLVESYWENVNWQYQPIPRAMFENDHVLSAYDTESSPNAHKLACVFFVMALGAMYDLNRPPFHPRGEQLFLLGRACISTVGIEQASPATVQAIHLMGTYILNDKRGNGGEVFWPILGTAVKIAQSLGLHRDGSHYGLSQYEIEERRIVWWEIVTYDRLQALCFGRPCSTSFRWSDTKIPEVPELINDETSFHRTKYQLMNLMERVIDVQTQVTPVSFSVVSQLDSDIREYKKNLADLLLPKVPIQELPIDPSVHPHLVIHRLGIRLQIAQMRLLLNRPLFARALKDSPDDPSRSKLGLSFVALFESAQEIVQLVKALVIYHPSLVARWWFFWFHAFSSAVCLAAIAIRAPLCAFASPSFHGMSIVCDISAAAREGCRAKRGLPILLRLRKRAQEALVAASRSKNKTTIEGTGEEDDLSHLVGSAKLRRVQHPRRPSHSSPGSAAMAVGVNGGLDGTPSPNSGGSIGTSSTLVEGGLYEGVVPSFPVDHTPSTTRTLPSSFSTSAGSQPPMASTSWPSDDPMNGYIPSTLSNPTSHWSNVINSSPIDIMSNMPFSPDNNRVDRDMSIAFGMNVMEMGMEMGMGVGVDMMSNRMGMIAQFDSGDNHMGNGLDGSPARRGGPTNADPEYFGFDFEAFVNQMGE
ncbi:uncharacterized protein L203_102447 [Cryptococcus depauperatus CBS 7841]|uniref:Zn(2)-C6 fungal-type domain-containing protein n=1 Tax=Cryptococcus depauperatus CBS 7841 TaxID=1295531 RepID=A0AAJ8M0C5_9TREE